MSELISRLRGLASDTNRKEEELRSYFTDLEQRLKDASGGRSIRGQSENCLLETYGDDDAYYGYLYYGENGLRIAYRTREEDMELTFENEPWEPTYHTQSLDTSNATWLCALSVPKIIESLLSSINTVVEEQLSATTTGIQTLLATTNIPMRDLDGGLVDAAKQLSFAGVITDWQDAQAALGVDPPEAATRASSLIEALCKHILETKGLPLPPNASIQQLYGFASREISLAPEQQTTADLRAIAGGMNTLVVGIGALRTHAGSAHGRGPSHQPINFSQARLAVNAAGVLTTFLMDALIAQTASISGGS